jgi:hypothetical protein
MGRWGCMKEVGWPGATIAGEAGKGVWEFGAEAVDGMRADLQAADCVTHREDAQQSHDAFLGGVWLWPWCRGPQ